MPRSFAAWFLFPPAASQSLGNGRPFELVEAETRETLGTRGRAEAVPDRGGKVVQVDPRAAREREGSFEDVLELSHVPRPRVFQHAFERSGRDFLGPNSVVPAEGRDEMLDEERDVLLALAEGGKSDRDDVQAVVEVRPKTPRRHFLLEVLVRRGHDPHVHVDRAGRAEGQDFLFLDGAQELDLQRQGDFRDLVEKQRSAFRCLEDPLVVLDGARESAPPVAEELAFEQGVGERPAVERDEGAVREGAFRMDGPRDEFLPGAVLALDEDVALVLRDGLDRLVDLAHGRAPADEFPEAGRPPELEAEAADLLAEAAQFQGLLHLEQEFVRMAGLDQVVARAELHGLDRGLDGTVAGEHEGRDVEGTFLHRAQQAHSVEHGHVEVGDDEVEGLAFESLECLGPVVGRRHAVTSPLEDLGQRPGHVGLVLDQEDATPCHRRADSGSVRQGSSIVKVVPSPT
ncbi:MAG: hypothetical protein KatS3mg076_0279 [Candidatus Binatia bacterium]|nr:MAG: hypothetical protein KatS3mg076_0279 [Candidatus Binatia bacterium]